jgi:hypothetical protein
MASPQLVDASGRCTLTHAQLENFRTQAEALHQQLLDKVTGAIDNVSETPSKQEEAQLKSDIETLIKLAPSIDAVVIMDHVCARANRGLKMPNVKLPGLSGR